MSHKKHLSQEQTEYIYFQKGLNRTSCDKYKVFEGQHTIFTLACSTPEDIGKVDVALFLRSEAQWDITCFLKN